MRMLLCSVVASIGLTATLLFCAPLRAKADKVLFGSAEPGGTPKAQPSLLITRAADRAETTARGLWAKTFKAAAPDQGQQEAESPSTAPAGDEARQGETN